MNNGRYSGVEKVKLIAMFSIVTAHVVQTLTSVPVYVTYSDYVIPIGNATNDISQIILNILLQGGQLGNVIFVVCSSYFLVDKTKTSIKKVINLLCTVWIISVIYYLIYRVLKINISSNLLRNIFLPTFCESNWYITCYILFIIIHPYINKVISITTKQELFRLMIFLTIVNIFINFAFHAKLYVTSLTIFITLYIIVAYLKKYCPNFMININNGITLLFIGIIGYILQVVATNYISGFINLFSSRLLHWSNMSSPFNCMIAIGLLIIANNYMSKNKFINSISKLTILIYLIHENIIFRSYTRTKIWHYIYNKIGHSNIVFQVIIYSAILFILSIIVGYLVDLFVKPIIDYISSLLYNGMKKLYLKIENVFLFDKIHKR